MLGSRAKKVLRPPNVTKSDEKYISVITVGYNNYKIRRTSACLVSRAYLLNNIRATEQGLPFINQLEYMDIVICKEAETELFVYTKDGTELYHTDDIDTFDIICQRVLKTEVALTKEYITEFGMTDEVTCLTNRWTKWDLKNIYIYEHTREELEEQGTRLVPKSKHTKESFIKTVDNYSKIITKLLIRSHIKELVAIFDYTYSCKEDNKEDELTKHVLGLVLIQRGTKGRSIENFSCIPLKLAEESYKEFTELF